MPDSNDGNRQAARDGEELNDYRLLWLPPVVQEVFVRLVV